MNNLDLGNLRQIYELESGVTCPTCKLPYGEGYILKELKDARGTSERYQLLPCPECNSSLYERQRRAGIPRSLVSVRLSECMSLPERAEVLKAARQFCNKPVGFFSLYGPVGRGKTHLTIAMCNELLLAGLRVLYTRLPDLCSRIREFEPLDRFLSVPVLAIDDMDYQSRTNFITEQLFRIIDYRYTAGLGGDEVGEFFGPRLGTIPVFQSPPDPADWLGSRVYDKRFRIFEISGPDLRRCIDVRES